MAEPFQFLVIGSFALMVVGTIAVLANTNYVIQTESTFNLVLLAWGFIGVWSGMSIWITGIMPLSNKIMHGPLAAFGTCGKRFGWIVMEASVLPVTLYFYLQGPMPPSASPYVVAPYFIHYIQRALIYPHRLCVRGETMPSLIVMASSSFYIMNGCLIGLHFGTFASYEWSWLHDPRFVIGWIMFVFGFVLNCTADSALIQLRRSNEPGQYAIPEGGMFNFVSCPHYLGECLEWVGFALLSWSLVGVVYAVWVNLALSAQARTKHNWYKNKFKEQYPDARRALIPFIF